MRQPGALPQEQELALWTTWAALETSVLVGWGAWIAKPPAEDEPVVVELYNRGYGYRAIANILNTPEYGINAHFSSIRKTLIRLGKVTGK